MNIKTLLSHFMKSKRVEISELRTVIEQSGNGHLPLSCRVELLQSIGNVEIVNKVFAECCKKVYPLWGNEIEDTLLRKLLCSADEYLYHGKGKADALVEEANRLRNYVEGQSCTESMAGWAVISLCYSIADHAATMLDIDEYEGEDDGAFDYEVWNTDFFASMAFAGGNPFVDEGDAGKRREFWNWYLDTVETLCRKSDVPLVRIDAPKKKEVEQNTVPQRTQTYQTPDILLKIQQIIEKSTKVFNDYCTGNWDRIIVEAHCIGDVRTEGYFICNNIVSKMPVSLSTADLLSEIKNEMYKQASIEGAWLMCKIVFDTQKKFIIEFNYDNKASLPNDVFDNPERLETAFKKSPRAKGYTPVWWQEILGKKAKYLKNTIIVEQFAIPQRAQTYRTPAILSKIQEVINNTLELNIEQCNAEWDKIVLLGCCMSTGINLEGYKTKGNQKYSIKVSLQSHYILDDVKKEMYNQAKAEGAWFYCIIELNPDLTYSIRFVYDDKSQIPQDHLVDSDDFVAEFKKYPRAKEYTPVWWQGILGKKAKYLKNTVIVEQLAIPQRTQTYQTPAIQEKIRQVIENSMKVYNENYTGMWDKIIIKAEGIDSITTNNHFISKGTTTKFPASWKNFDLMEEIKDEMYSQADIEGAWLTCTIELMPNKTFTVCFNYDEMLDNITPDNFSHEFKNYPRTKEYTPMWWQEILGKKAKYLE